MAEEPQEWALLVKSEGIPTETAYLCDQEEVVFTKPSQTEIIEMAVKAMKFGRIFVETNHMIFLVPVNKVLWMTPFQLKRSPDGQG